MKERKWNGVLAYLAVWSLCILLYSCVGMFVVNDGFWHMAIGRYIVHTGSIPKTAVGVWGGDSLSWLSQEWLYEWFSYVLFRDNMFWMCLSAVVLVALSLLFVGFFAGLYKDLYQKPIQVVLYVFVSTFVLLSFSVPRPQTVSLLLMVVFVYKLRKVLYCQVSWSDYLILFVIGILWANFHAGTAILAYLIPLGIAVCYTITDKFSWFSNHFDVTHVDGAVNRISVVACLMLVSNLCTPHGLQGLLYPLRSMGDAMMLHVVTEWAQPNINDVAGLLMYYLPFVLFYGWLYLSKVRMKLFDIAVITFLFLMAVLHMRLTLYLLPVLLLLWIPYLNCKPKYTFRIKSLVSVLCVVACLTLSVFQISKNDLSSEGYENEFWQIVKENAGDRMYNYYDLGSILQYYEIPVFVDARYDPFSENRMPDFVQMEYGDSASDEFEKLMQKYDFTSVLSRRSSHVVQYAKDHGFEKLAEWDTEVSGVDMTGNPVDSVYEFWVKK